MEKNTVWAISLSTIVLVGFFVAQSILFPPKKSQVTNTSTSNTETVSEVKSDANSVTENILVEAEENLSENLNEEFYTIETNLVKVTFTNKGGDVVSYMLKNHPDTDTGKDVEMAANVRDGNRAFAISFGGSDKNIINDFFTAKKIDDNTIGFFKKYSGKNGEFTLVKTYTFKNDDYFFKLDVTVDGSENFTGLDFNGNAYSLRTSPQIGPAYNPKNRYDIREFISFDGEKKYKPKSVGNTRNWTWTGVAGKYFEILVSPASDVEKSNSMKFITPSKNGDVADSQFIFSRNSFNSKNINDSYYIFVGPRNEKEFKKYNVADKNEWKLEGKHFNESLPTSGILSWIEIVLKFIMEMIYKVIPNWGVSIIILTVLLKMALYPLTKKSLMGTQKMGQLQPRMQAIQEKYRDNPQKMQQETAKLYKEVGYNPMSGCLPLIFQFIILWSMYHLFNNYFEFRGASFIPGWISDLSGSDVVATLKFNIPLLGNEIHILPVIYLVSQLLFGKITQNGGTSAGQSAGQMKMMMYGMPILFFFMFYSAPSGLLLYWTVSNIIQLIQQLFINSVMKNKKVQAVTVKGKRK